MFVHYRNSSAILPFSISFTNSWSDPTRRFLHSPSKRVKCSSGILYPLSLTVEGRIIPSYEMQVLNTVVYCGTIDLIRHHILVFSPRPTRELHEPNRTASPRDFLFPISLALFHERNSWNWENRRRNSRALRYPEILEITQTGARKTAYNLLQRQNARRISSLICRRRGTLFPLERLRLQTTKGVSHKRRVISMNRRISSYWYRVNCMQLEKIMQGTIFFSTFLPFNSRVKLAKFNIKIWLLS